MYSLSYYTPFDNSDIVCLELQSGCYSIYHQQDMPTLEVGSVKWECLYLALHKLKSVVGSILPKHYLAANFFLKKCNVPDRIQS